MRCRILASAVFGRYHVRTETRKSPNVLGEAVSGDTDTRSADQQTPGDGELVRAARRGELKAFEALVGRYQRQATAVAFRLLNNREDAMDVVQEAFLKAYDRLDSLSRPERFAPWLLRIVSNVSLNFRRARALRRGESLDAVGDDHSASGHLDRLDAHVETPPQAASAKELRQLLAEAIDRLPDKQRQALVLFCIEKLPQKQIAEMLGCSVEAVKWHVFTARKKLKDQFRDYL